MTTYNTGNPVPSADARDRYDNSQTFDEVVNGTLDSYVNRVGNPVKSLAGMNNEFNQFLINSGFEPTHLIYVDGTPLTVARPTQLIDRAGSVYRVKMPAVFPVNLSGSWSADQVLLVEVSENALRQELANTSDPYQGSALVGRQSMILNNVAELRATAGRFDGDVAIVKNYELSDGKGEHCPADWIVVALPAVPPADDGGMIIRVAGVSNAYWRRRLNSRGMVDGEVYGLPTAAGQDSYEKLEAIAAYCAATKISCFLGKGPLDKGMFVSSPEYDTFERSMPFSGPRDPGFALVNFGYEIWSEPGAVFQTTSSGGADVFNLCSMENFGIRGFPTIRGFLTAFTGSGSNAVSMVFGVRNVIIEAHVENMPTIWLMGGGTDGGHGYTTQIAGGTVNPVDGIVLRGSVKGCTSGVNVDGSLTDSILRPYTGINIDDLEVEDCYYGFGATGTTPTASIVDPRSPQPCMSISGNMRIKNCQRAVFAGRLFGGKLHFEVYNDKEKEDLIRNVNSPSVYVAEILGVKHLDMSIDARVLSVDHVINLGAVGMGGNAFPATEHSNIDIRARYTSATVEFDTGLAGTAPLRNSTVRLNGFVAVPDRLVTESQSSDVFINGSRATPTIYPGDASAQASGGSLSVVVFDVPLTATRSADAPSYQKKGDQVIVIRTAASTGASNAIGPDGSTAVATNTRANYTYSGSAWVRMP